MSVSPSDSRGWLAVAALVTLLGLWLQMQTLGVSLALGGHKWLQGDWLINLAAGPVRRGPMGEALLTLAEWAGLAPLHLLLAVQGLLAVSLALGLVALLAMQRRGVMALAVLSPGFFALLWGVDQYAALRKEMIGLLALLLLSLPGLGRGRATVSATLLAVGAWGHEINILMFPAWLLALGWFLGPPAPRFCKALAIVTGLAVVLALAYALRYRAVADIGPVCAAATAGARVSVDFCDGAIAWLSDPGNGSGKVMAALQDNAYAPLIPAAWGLAAAPLLRLWRLSAAPALSGWLLVAAALPFFLLYPVGLDWGRWLAVQVSVVSILLLGLSARGRLIPVRAIHPAELPGWLALALAVGISGEAGLLPFGFLRQF